MRLSLTKLVKTLFLLVLFSLNIFAFRKISLETFKNLNDSSSLDYIFRWWDIVEIKKDSRKCKSYDFNETKFLKISCREYEIAKWLKAQKGQENIDILSIVPAQTLFYRLKGFNHKKTKYLTVTWNDFSNRKKANEKFNYLLDSIKEDCSGNQRVVFILFPTSESTINGSKQNFKSAKEQIFIQEKIENTLLNFDNICIKRESMKLVNGKNIVHWIEFYVPYIKE